MKSDFFGLENNDNKCEKKKKEKEKEITNSKKRRYLGSYLDEYLSPSSESDGKIFFEKLIKVFNRNG